jgi:succinate dehydrogenase / fumarate reductase cytochrome b subunit
MSPYMLGPYYKFQITSLLSILNRLTGVFMSVVSAPLLLCWLIALASGDAAFAGLSAWLGSVLGKLVVVASVFSYLSGWLAIIGSIVLTLIVMGAGL